MNPERYKDATYGEVRRVPGLDYSAYYPKTLPRSLQLAPETVTRLADAEAALGRLAGAGRLLPNPHLLIRPYLLREALASARIEGTQASLLGVLDAEADEAGYTPDIEEVLNYVAAMEEGLVRLDAIPFSLRLVREMHAILLRGVRGQERQPGEFRTSQNWIGPPGSQLRTARFVPPPAGEIGSLLTDWETFAHQSPSIPVLAQTGLLHYQFETIHPFLDGNGRMGRLLIVFHLVIRGRLPQPLLYLSSYFERHRDEYFARLQGVRERGELDGWLCFYLKGVETQAHDAVVRSEHLVDLRESYRSRVVEATRSQAIELVDALFANPVITARQVERIIEVQRATSLRLLDQLADLGILTETASGQRRQRRFIAQEILSAIEDDLPA